MSARGRPIYTQLSRPERIYLECFSRRSDPERQGTNSVTILWNSSGAQTVSVNYTNANGCTAASPTSYAVTVKVAPTPTITGPSTACADPGFNINYSTEGRVYRVYLDDFQWREHQFGPGDQPGPGDLELRGAQTLSVNYTNGNGCSAANATVLNVTVTTVPDAAGAITGTSAVCVAEPRE